MPVSVWSTWFGVSGSSTSSRRSLEPQLPEKAAYCRTSGIFTCFYLNREPHLALSFSKVSEPLPLRRRGDLLETPRVSFWMTSREIAQEAHLLVPTCRAQSSRSGPAAERHLAPSPASNYWAGRRVGLSSSPPRPPPAPAPPLSVSVVEPRSRLQSPQTHRFTSLAELSALE